MATGNKKRRTVFIKRGFQTRFILWVVGLLVLCCLCSAAVLYPLLSSEMNTQLTSSHPNFEAAGGRLIIAIVLGNVLAIVVAALATAVVILYVSHKIAGPLYRFEMICEQVGSGNLDVSTGLREADQLKGLSEAFGKMLTQLRDRRSNQSASLEKAKGNLNALRAVVSDTEATSELESLEKLLTSLSEEA